MFTQSAQYYDAIYAALGKHYPAEVRRIVELLKHHGITDGGLLLDVGCGTGGHLQLLSKSYAVEGLDLDRGMLAIAAARCPTVPLHQTDMINFNLGKRFDAIVCLFGSIGYVPNVERLNQTLQTFARHLRPGGVCILEPWIFAEDWRDGQLHAAFVDEPHLKLARMSISRSDGRTSIINFHYLAGETDGIRSFKEAHRLTLFTDEEYRQAFERAKFSVEAVSSDFFGGRGLYVGYQSSPSSISK